MTKTQIFPGRYDSLEKISEFIQENTKNAGFDGFTSYTIETAVDEACSNIIEHAYGQENIGDIEISVSINPSNLTIYIKDNGKPFNPKSIPKPNLSSNLYERKGDGLGLYMMRQWMDEVQFEFVDNKNVLKMVKNKGQ
ncbi:MAG: ATP-binding protein [Anaerolineaceae bacterium]|nr:MAG: ATP-binding protein [Chloroflexi bacterium HGW-Chloroflexi-8]